MLFSDTEKALIVWDVDKFRILECDKFYNTSEMCNTRMLTLKDLLFMYFFSS